MLLNIYKQMAMFLFILIVIAVLPMHVKASNALEGTATGIDVLRLPDPTILDVDSATGLISLSIPKLDTEIIADLRLIVSLYNHEGGELIEKSEVKILSVRNIKVPLLTPIQNSYFVTAQILNGKMQSDIDSTETKKLETVPPVMHRIEMYDMEGNLIEGSSFDAPVKIKLIATDNVKINEILYALSSSPYDEDLHWLSAGAGGEVEMYPEFCGYINAKAVDFAGNVSNTLDRRIILDTTAPVLEAVTLEQLDGGYHPSGSEFEIYHNDVRVLVTASDNFEIEGVLYAITNTDEPPEISEWKLMPSVPSNSASAATHELIISGESASFLNVKAVDTVGLESEKQIFPYMLDKTDPVIDEITLEHSNIGAIDFIKSLLGVHNSDIQITVEASDNLGIKQIEYCITGSAEIPDGIVWNLLEDNKLTVKGDIDSIVHIRVRDKSDRVSEIKSRRIMIDSAAPELTYELAGRENEYAPVVIRVTAVDDSSVAGVSGIDHIVNPLGVQEQTNYIEYAVIENGSYDFKAADMVGNETVLTVDIDNILQIKREDWEGNQPVIDAILHATGKHNIEDIKYADMQEITFLDMSANGIKELPYILRLAIRLEYLDLRGNELKTIPECVYGFKSLKLLDLSNNNLTEIGGRIAGLKNLGELDVSLNYLVDYDSPIIVPKYRDIGNFTLNNREGQYSYRILDTVSTREYIGNTIKYTVEWSCGGEILDISLESHRKELFTSMYPAYHTYRPLLFDYEIQNGQFKAGTPDYVQVFLNGTGIMSATMKLGE